jgi:hypothetical protein
MISGFRLRLIMPEKATKNYISRFYAFSGYNSPAKYRT